MYVRTGQVSSEYRVPGVVDGVGQKNGILTRILCNM